MKLIILLHLKEDNSIFNFANSYPQENGHEVYIQNENICYLKVLLL